MQRTFKASVLVCILFAATTFFGCSNAALTQANTADYEIYREFPGMEKPYEGPLPWDGEGDFIEAVGKHITPVKMAAYKATLPNPVESESYNIGLAAKQLAGTVVRPGETFSQNSVLGPYTEQRGFRTGPTYVGNRHITTVGGGVCKVASMLYNVTTFSDLKAITRHHHSMTVPYVPPGQDATVYYGAKDFRFLNDTDSPILIWSQKIDNTLYMALYGRKKPPEVTWAHLVKNRTDFSTEYRHNPKLPPGTEKEISSGQDGYVIVSWVSVKKPDGTVTVKKKGTSWYNASPRIVERGPRE
ncbi:MAG TPA: VanW family protein [Clostridia bacterium]|nr:VanW family protein [Clostridia bacterium]